MPDDKPTKPAVSEKSEPKGGSVLVDKSVVNNRETGRRSDGTRIILVCGAAAMLISTSFPPWVDKTHPNYPMSTGLAFLFSPPYEGASLDFGRLALEWVGLAAATGVVLGTAKLFPARARRAAALSLSCVACLSLVVTGVLGFAHKKGLSEAKEVALPESEVAKLTGKAKITSYGYITIDIVNHSQYELSALRVRVAVRGNDPFDVKLDRKYWLTPGTIAGEFSADLTFNLARGQTWTWEILSAQGTLRNEPRRVEIKGFGTVEFPTSMSPDEIKAAIDQHFYTVKQGDTLGGIAKQFATTLNDIQRDNHLPTTNLTIGQRLFIPGNAITFQH